MSAKSRSPWIPIVEAVLGIAAVGALDHVTGFEVRIYPLYFVPIARVAWRLSRRWALAAAVLAAGILASARRSQQPVTLAYLDLDNFKAVNDTHGHQEGDRALAITGRILSEQVRSTDVAARLGGDEFAVMLLGAGESPSRATLERIRLAVATAMKEHDWPVTVSVGAVCYEQAPDTVDELVRAADDLMYRSKKDGKNQLRLELIPMDRGG